MAAQESSSIYSTILRTSRLRLRLADPSSPADIDTLVNIYNTHYAARAALSQALVKTITADEILLKHELNGPKAEFCTKMAPPRGMYHLIYLAGSGGDGTEDVLIGNVILNTRRGMVCPDMGYAILMEYEGHGYVTEAAKECLRFWRDIVGVKEIFCGTSPENVKSQRVAERIGFVEGGWGDYVLGFPPDELREKMKVFVLPGMTWPEGQVLYGSLRRE